MSSDAVVIVAAKRSPLGAFQGSLAGASGTDLGAARMGPFLLAKGQTYEVMIDARFSVGTHDYVCTPHEMMGMKGTITVQESDPNGRLEEIR